MSVKSFDDALDFVPTSKTVQPRGGFVASVITFFQGIEDGLNAARDYKQLTAAGMTPEKAARRVFDSNFDRR